MSNLKDRLNEAYEGIFRKVKERQMAEQETNMQSQLDYFNGGSVTSTGGALGGQWPNYQPYAAPPSNIFPYDPWANQQEMDKHADEWKRLMEQIRIQKEQAERQSQAHAKAMNKKDMMSGILKEIVAMRERLDQITAHLAAEILEDKTEPETGFQSTLFTMPKVVLDLHTQSNKIYAYEAGGIKELEGV